MNKFDKVTLSNGIRLIIRKNPNTPRIAIHFYIDAGIKCESLAGVANLAGRLLMQGTKTRTAQELANELDLNAIELDVDTRQDYTKIKAISLNEDFDKALDILADVIKNSTFADFEKELRKYKGEIDVELDSPKAKTMDNLVKNVYPDHPYGNSIGKVLEALPKITPEAVKDHYYSTLVPEAISISIAGDIEKESIIKSFEAKFGDLKSDHKKCVTPPPASIPKNKTVKIVKDDAAQAQIVQGWLVPAISDEDCVKLHVLNTILGAGGLSSRLFLELRDKKGLAYHVRSTYESFKHSGIFYVYIGTAPHNINTAKEGFDYEIKRLQDEIVPEKELEEAKNNYLGKRSFFHETNSQQAYYLGYYDILGLGPEYDEKIPEMVKKVTAQDIKDLANKYFSGNSVISILAPQEALRAV